jgi:hypothetical protein
MTVRITKEGLKFFEWNSDLREHVETRVRSFETKLRCHCEIDLGVTLGDIFDAVQADPGLSIFLGDYSWCDVEAFHREAKRPAIKKSDLSFLELSSYFEADGEGFHLSFSGIGQDSESYAIEFTPVNELAHLEVRLDPKCKVFKNCEPVEGLEATVSYSLLDVLGEIYYEISFLGSPADRDEKGAELLQLAEDVKSGKLKTVPLEGIETKHKPN